MPFKFYKVKGVSRPLRLSPEHAEKIGAKFADQPESGYAPVVAKTVQAVPDEDTVTEREADEQAQAGRVDEGPSKSSSKAEWVDAAVESGMDRDEAEALNKSQLVGKFGG